MGAHLSETPKEGIAPHPPLKGYYAPYSQRQDFLNDLSMNLLRTTIGSIRWRPLVRVCGIVQEPLGKPDFMRE